MESPFRTDPPGGRRNPEIPSGRTLHPRARADRPVRAVVSRARVRCYIDASEIPPRRAKAVSRTRDPSNGKPQPLGDLLTRFLDKSGLTPKIEAAAVIPEWADRVGPQIAAVTEPIRLSDGTLFVAVRNSAWMMELNLMKAELMRHVNAGQRGGRITQIVFVMSGG